MNEQGFERMLGRRALLAGGLGLGAALGASSLWSADAPAGKEEPPKIPAPEEIDLTTKDHVVLKCTYFASLLGKKAPTVILVHGWAGQRSEWDAMGLELQRLGYAVIAPDLRGHGGSTRQKNPMVAADITLDREKFGLRDFQAMSALDLETVKGFLIERNNAEELNVEALCIVGAEFGAIVAVNWAIIDWSWPQLPSLKQGQDVKALALLSPTQVYKQLRMPQLNQWGPVATLSTLIAVGKKESSAFRYAKSLHSTLERSHFKPTNAPDKRAEELPKLDLFFMEPDTSLQGTKLLGDASLRVAAALAQFLDLRLTRRMDKYVWAKR